MSCRFDQFSLQLLPNFGLVCEDQNPDYELDFELKIDQSFRIVVEIVEENQRADWLKFIEVDTSCDCPALAMIHQENKICHYLVFANERDVERIMQGLTAISGYARQLVFEFTPSVTSHLAKDRRIHLIELFPRMYVEARQP